MLFKCQISNTYQIILLDFWSRVRRPGSETKTSQMCVTSIHLSELKIIINN